jgi:hypothetical protein
MATLVLAIDPGPEESAYVLWDGAAVHEARKVKNVELLLMLKEGRTGVVVIERIESYGMPVGVEIFDTVFWAGRLAQRAADSGCEVFNVPRRKVKLHLCEDSRARDSNIRQAIIDRFGGKEATKKGGALCLVKGDCWQALALALMLSDNRILVT